MNDKDKLRFTQLINDSSFQKGNYLDMLKSNNIFNFDIGSLSKDASDESSKLYYYIANSVELDNKVKITIKRNIGV